MNSTLLGEYLNNTTGSLSFWFYTDKHPDKLDLQKLLAPIEHQWRPIGEALKVDHGSIMSVENTVAYTNTVRLSHILQLWMEQNPCSVTWRTIIDAIKKPPVKNSAIANKIVAFLSKPDTISRYMN